MTLKTAIVDDEAPGRERLRQLLAREPDVELTAMFSNGAEALEGLPRTSPDLLLLDVQMPDMSGFDILRSLSMKPLPWVIFVTAYDTHAVAAFDARAVDYVLKPVKPSRFRRAMASVRERIASHPRGHAAVPLSGLLGALPASPDYLTRFTVKVHDRTVLVRATDVEWIEAAGNYAVLHTRSERHMLRETMAALEAMLAPRQFVRVSRSAIVNVEAISEFKAAGSGGDQVILTRNGTRIALTRSARELDRLLRFC